MPKTLGPIYKSPVAKSVFFDPTNCDIIDKKNVQGAIEDLCTKIQTAASPGFSFGRQGNISNGTFLNRPGGVPSNRTGVNFGLSNGSLDVIAVGTENLDTYTIKVWQHDGNFINPVEITTVSITSSRKEVLELGVDYTLTNSLVKNKQIAIEITAGSARNLGVDLELSGDRT